MPRYLQDPPDLTLHLEAICVVARAAWWKNYADGYMAAMEHFRAQREIRECTAADLGLKD